MRRSSAGVTDASCRVDVLGNPPPPVQSGAIPWHVLELMELERSRVVIEDDLEQFLENENQKS